MKNDRITDAISSIDQDIVENFVLLDVKLQKKAATRRSRMIKILSSAACLVLVLSISMSFIFDRKEPTSSGEPPRTYRFESEEDLLLFLDLIRKDPSELAEYDILEVRKDDPYVMYDTGLEPGEVFILPLSPYELRISAETMRITQQKLSTIGYFTAKDSSTVEKFSHTYYRDYSGTKTISYSVITIDGIAYCFTLRKTGDQKKSDIKNILTYTRRGGKFYMSDELEECKILLYKMKNPNAHLYLEGLTYFEDYTVSMRIFVYNKKDIDKINLEQFVWRDYYEE